MADHTLQSTIEIAGSLSPSLQSAINAAVSRLEEMSKETLEHIPEHTNLMFICNPNNPDGRIWNKATPTTL